MRVGLGYAAGGWRIGHHMGCGDRTQSRGAAFRYQYVLPVAFIMQVNCIASASDVISFLAWVVCQQARA